MIIWFATLLNGCTAPPDIPVCRKLNHKKVMIKDNQGLPVKGSHGRPLYNYRPNPVCMREIKEPVCGRCTWTIEDKVQYVGEAEKTWLDGKPWSEIFNGAAILPSRSSAKVKEYIMTQCKKIKSCNDDIKRWRVKMDSFDSVGEAIKK